MRSPAQPPVPRRTAASAAVHRRRDCAAPAASPHRPSASARSAPDAGKHHRAARRQPGARPRARAQSRRRQCARQSCRQRRRRPTVPPVPPPPASRNVPSPDALLRHQVAARRANLKQRGEERRGAAAITAETHHSRGLPRASGRQPRPRHERAQPRQRRHGGVAQRASLRRVASGTSPNPPPGKAAPPPRRRARRRFPPAPPSETPSAPNAPARLPSASASGCAPTASPAAISASANGAMPGAGCTRESSAAAASIAAGAASRSVHDLEESVRHRVPRLKRSQHLPTPPFTCELLMRVQGGTCPAPQNVAIPCMRVILQGRRAVGRTSPSQRRGTASLSAENNAHAHFFAQARPLIPRTARAIPSDVAPLGWACEGYFNSPHRPAPFAPARHSWHKNSRRPPVWRTPVQNVGKAVKAPTR